MKYVLFPLHLLYKLYVGAIFWITLVLLYPIFYYLLKKRRFRRVFKLKRFWSRTFQVLLFSPIRIKWKAKLPEPPYIICSNHSSYFDIVLFYSVFPHYFLFIGKGELLNWPLFRLFFRKMDIPIHRENFRQSYGALKRAYDSLDQGSCIAIFPEGTIPDSAPKMKGFKNGAFKMAIDKQVPIVPVTWKNNYRRFGEPTDLWSGGHPGVSNVVVHEAVSCKGLSDEDLIPLRQQIFKMIDSELPEKHRKYNEDGDHR